MLIKYDMSSYIDLTIWMQTFIPFMRRTVTDKDTLVRMIGKLMLIIISQVRIACTTKPLEHFVIWLMIEELFIGSKKFQSCKRQPIDMID